MTDLLVKLIGTGLVSMSLFSFVGMVEHQRAGELVIIIAWIGLLLSILLVAGSVLALIWL